MDCSISPDGRWVASGGADGIVKIWELDTGKIIKNLQQHAPGKKHTINCLDYNP